MDDADPVGRLRTGRQSSRGRARTGRPHDLDGSTSRVLKRDEEGLAGGPGVAEVEPYGLGARRLDEHHPAVDADDLQVIGVDGLRAVPRAEGDRVWLRGLGGDVPAVYLQADDIPHPAAVEPVGRYNQEEDTVSSTPHFCTPWGTHLRPLIGLIHSEVISEPDVRRATTCGCPPAE